jgi:hypothetical protein
MLQTPETTYLICFLYALILVDITPFFVENNQFAIPRLATLKAELCSLHIVFFYVFFLPPCIRYHPLVSYVDVHNAGRNTLLMMASLPHNLRTVPTPFFLFIFCRCHFTTPPRRPSILLPDERVIRRVSRMQCLVVSFMIFTGK